MMLLLKDIMLSIILFYFILNIVSIYMIHI